jgi:molybdopterin/thiamine biosynthesis adenylyltransferase
METTDYYNAFFTRNSGYISPELQERIRKTKVLIAGCGMGSTIAESLVRIGVETIILADVDTVAEHNLNRQSYIYADIGTKKTEALKRHLIDINPHLLIKTYDDGITEDNVADILNQTDFIFDTIDFLSMTSIVALHDSAHLQKKPIISAVNTGFGAATLYFPKDNDNEYSGFRKLFGLPMTGSVEKESYVTHFKSFIQKIHDEIDPLVAEVMAQAFTVMEDGKPCPASQVSAGSFANASLSTTLFCRILNGDPVSVSPHLLTVNMSLISTSEGVDLSK